MERDYKHKK